MYVITVTTHGGEQIEAMRETLEAAQRYETLLRRGGISLPGRWLSPSNILEVVIHELRDPPEFPTNTKSAPKVARPKRNKVARSSDAK